MKKLFRNISVMVALAAITSTQAQIFSLEDQVNNTEVDYEDNLFDSNSENFMPGGGNPVDIDDNDPEDPDPSPINDYVPFLLIGAAGLAVYYRKQILAKI